MADASRIDDSDVWTCCICQKVTSEKIRGIKIHITRMHGNDNGSKIEDFDEDSYNDAMLLVETSLNSEFNQDFETSIMKERFQTNDEDSESDNSDSDYESPVQKESRHEREQIWMDQMMENSKINVKSETDASIVYSCSICSDFNSKSEKGMKLHITKLHGKEMREETRKRFRKSKEGFSQQNGEFKLSIVCVSLLSLKYSPIRFTS